MSRLEPLWLRHCKKVVRLCECFHGYLLVERPGAIFQPQKAYGGIMENLWDAEYKRSIVAQTADDLTNPRVGNSLLWSSCI